MIVTIQHGPYSQIQGDLVHRHDNQTATVRVGPLTFTGKIIGRHP